MDYCEPTVVRKFFRNVKGGNLEFFKTQLDATDWSNVSSCEKVDEAFSIFLDRITFLFQSSFPLTPVRSNSKQKP